MVLQVSAEPIQSPCHQHVHSAPPSLSHEFVECRPAFLCPADGVVNVLSDGPALRLRVAAQLEHLVLGRLVSRADARIQRGGEALLSCHDGGRYCANIIGTSGESAK